MNVLMPQLGETVTEGTISKWYKAVGDTVAAGETLVDIETDKTSMEVPAVVAGTLSEINAQEGQTVAVGTIIATLAETGSAPMPSPEAAQVPTAPGQATAVAAYTPIDPYHGLRTPEVYYGKATLPGGVKITPSARRLAAQAGIDPASLQGSGPRGRIVAGDVRRAADSGLVVAPPRLTPAAVDPVRSLYADTPHREVGLDGMRRQIARRLVESKQQVPHFYLSADANVDALLALRKQYNDSAQARVSLNDLLVKAYALALQKVPAANVVWAGDALLQLERSDVGVAVAVSGGLVTPIVRSADSKPLADLASELAGLVARGRDRRLQPHEYSGGSATVSNLGMYGVRSFQAIVNPPQATILAVGVAERRPVEASDGSWRAASLLTVTLSVDHRAVDGATAAELLAAFRTLLENPLQVFLPRSGP
jgi:pyruvate dehydrogenase E2 component (dihydrolipoamide acetyltransferase)